MPTVRDQAICLRVWDWSETSQTVSVFSRELGVLRAVAKGSRRGDARFSGGLEVATRGEIVAIVKPSERSPDTLATLTVWDLQEIFPALRTSLSAFHGAMYMVDLVRHFAKDADPHPLLFDALLGCLRALGNAEQVVMGLLRFQWEMLTHTGHRPELFRDVSGAGELPPGQTFRFSPSLGGLVGSPAGTDARRPDPGDVWRVRPETIETLRRVADAGRNHGGVGPAAFAPEAVGRANRLLAWYVRTVLGTWPESAHTVFPGIRTVKP